MPTMNEGDYPPDEAVETIRDRSGDHEGVPATELADDTLLRELESLHRTRHETLLHGSTQALAHHSERTTELELEYLRRHPERDIDPDRLRAGAGQGSGPR